MPKIAEKPDLMNAIVVRVWTELGTGRFLEPEVPCFYVNLRKTGHGMDYSWLYNRLFGKIIDVVRRKSCFVNV